MASQDSPGSPRHFKIEKTITAILSWGPQNGKQQLWVPPQNKKFHLFNEQSALWRGGECYLRPVPSCDMELKITARWEPDYLSSQQRYEILKSNFQIKTLSHLVFSISPLPLANVRLGALAAQPCSWGDGRFESSDSTSCWKSSKCIFLSAYSLVSC